MAIEDAIFARKLTTAVRKLGPFLRTAIDNELQLNRARGDLGKVKAAIVKVLNQWELDNIEENDAPGGTLGRGLNARGDPIREYAPASANSAAGSRRDKRKAGTRNGTRDDDRPRHPDRPHIASDGKCHNCTLLNKSGACMHWNDDCPYKADAKAERTRIREKKAAAAPAAAKEEPPAAGRANRAATTRRKQRASVSRTVPCGNAPLMRHSHSGSQVGVCHARAR